jgi:signal transduction histidine kinase
MEILHPCPDVAARLEECQSEIQSAWIEALLDLPGSHYQETSEDDLLSWTASGLVAVTESLRWGSKEPLIAHAAAVSLIRGERGFCVNEVVEGLLLMRAAADGHLLDAQAEARGQSPDPMRYLDAALRILVSRVARLFAEAMSESLREERDRTTYLLNATEAAGESLDLSLVMPTVAQSIRRALGYSHCSIYLWDEAIGVFSPCAVAEDIQDPRLGSLLRKQLDPTTNSFAAGALSAKEISTFRSSSGCRFGAVSCSELGISVAVVHPIRLGDRLLAFSLSLDTDSDADFDPKALVLASGIAKSVAPAVDNARRHTETLRLLAESQRLQAAVESLLEMHGLEDLIATICHAAETLTGANGSAVFLDEEGAVSAFSFKRGEARYLRDEELLPTSTSSDQHLTTLPLNIRSHSLGKLVLIGDKTAFDQDASRLATDFADQAAIAIQHALLHRQQEELATLKERQRLAQELHDSATQSIYAVTMHVAAAERLLQAEQTQEVLSLFSDLRKISLDALREMRRLVFELRPSPLEEEGLVSALRARLSAVEGRAGLVTEFSADSEAAVPIRVAEALYGIATEALNNVLNHAEASQVSIRLMQLETSTILDISDDGVGFEETEAGTGGGMGLLGMRERARAVDAEIAISSSAGKGTTVRVEVPVDAMAERPGISEVTT